MTATNRSWQSLSHCFSSLSSFRSQGTLAASFLRPQYLSPFPPSFEGSRPWMPKWCWWFLYEKVLSLLLVLRFKNQELLACLEAKRAAVDDFWSFNLDSSDSKSPAIPVCRVGKLIHRCKWFISIYLNTGCCSLGQDASCEGSHHSPPARCFWRARRAFYTVQVTFAWIIA